MNDWRDQSRSDDARTATRNIRLAFALSIALHVALLWEWLPRPDDLSFDRSARGKGSGPLRVELAPQPRKTEIAPKPPSPPAPPPAPQARPVVPKPAPKAVPPPPPPPPVIAQKTPAPPVAPPPVAAAPPAPARAPTVGDFYADLEARRRTRGAAASPSAETSASAEEDEKQRHNRIVAENLGLNRTPTYGNEPKGGGIFRIESIGSDHAEFVFFGWNKDIRRKSKQTIEVRKGEHANIRLAVVRRIIGIIRDHESADFVWVSERLGRNITLSARPSENAELEDFMMLEFFADSRRTN
jgi:hypothetical protein